MSINCRLKATTIQQTKNFKSLALRAKKVVTWNGENENHAINQKN